MTPFTLPDCLAIDPGPEDEHGIIEVVDGAIERPKCPWAAIEYLPPKVPVLIESLASYGSPIGDDVLRTAYNIGRLYERAQNGERKVIVIRRTDVRYAVLLSTKGTDAILWQSIRERWGGPNAEKNGGPLHGITKHNKQALALAVAYAEMLSRGDVKAVRF